MKRQKRMRGQSGIDRQSEHERERVRNVCIQRLITFPIVIPIL